MLTRTTWYSPALQVYPRPVEGSVWWWPLPQSLLAFDSVNHKAGFLDHRTSHRHPLTLSGPKTPGTPLLINPCDQRKKHSLIFCTLVTQLVMEHWAVPFPSQGDCSSPHTNRTCSPCPPLPTRTSSPSCPQLSVPLKWMSWGRQRG